MSDARISGLYRLGVGERIAKLEELGWLGKADAARLRSGQHVLPVAAADRMIENVIGVFGLPFAIAPNFIVNGRECIVPLVVEEPSIVAGLSSVAALARTSGGFDVSSSGSLLIGQVHVADTGDPDHAIAALESAKPSLLEAANAVHPRLAERGGGVRDIEIRLFAFPDGRPLIALHVLVDTCDAMGANLVNTICEAIAPDVEAACGGRAVLRILSNLADRSLYTATARFDLPEEVCEAIVTANDVALVDPYRAATHNKGIMNGVDAVALATGNDWRAIEAGAHAFAAARGRYQALTHWRRAEDGTLAGDITLPLKVATVGGTLANNPAAALGLALTGATSAQQLAETMAAVGLAQNLAALRALVTSGIHAGHMKLHARSVVAAAGVPEEQQDAVVEALVESGDIKASKAREIARTCGDGRVPAGATRGAAAAKIILLGEHGVVYGRHALAVPIAGAVEATVARSGAANIRLPRAVLECLLDELGIAERDWTIRVNARVPFGKGLGSSAAVAVAIARAFDEQLGLGLGDERINEIAFASEKLAHGTPSGVDNTLATFARAMLFRNDGGLTVTDATPPTPPPLLVAWGSETGRTSEQVAGVRARYECSREHYERIFDAMDRLSCDGAALLRSGRWDELGRLMNVNHGLLNAIGVSTPGLEAMVSLARNAGAAGAKLTGAGGGGSIVAICPDRIDAVDEALRQSGYRTLIPGRQDDA